MNKVSFSLTELELIYAEIHFCKSNVMKIQYFGT